MIYVLLITGLIMLLAGGEGLVRGSVSLSERMGLSKAFVGIAVIGFGTSMPEMVVSIEAALIDRPGIAVGNIIGSNIANVFLILGTAALIKTQVTTSKILWRDGLFLVFATILVTASLHFMDLGVTAGVAMLVLFIAFLWHVYRTEKAIGPDEPEDLPHMRAGRRRQLITSALLSLAGVVALAYGASLFVDSAAKIAANWGVPPAIIGLSVVAIGTSLPELVAGGMAAWRGQTELVVGNIIGSNIFNLMLVLGTTALFTPISLSDVPVKIDLWVMVGATALLIFGLSTRLRLDRWEAVLFLSLYAGYCVRLATA